MSNLKEFIKITKQNNGATYSLNTGEINPKEGFYVGLEGGEKIENLNNIAEDIQTFVLTNSLKLADKDHYLGSWIEDSVLYLDVALRVDNLEDAINLGMNNKQVAIYDAANQDVINI